MDKVLVEVYVPILNSSYDIFIPVQSHMYEVLELIKKAISELSGGKFIPNNSTVICHRKGGEIININLSVCELDIQNGSKLMLI